MTDEAEIRERRRLAVLQRLQSLHRAGLRQLPRPDRQAVETLQQTFTGAAPRVEPIVEAPSATPSSSASPSSASPAATSSAPTPTAAASSAEAPPVSRPAPRPVASTSLFSGQAGGSDMLGRAATLEQRRDALRLVADEVAGCTRCALSRSRTQTVFGVGNPMTRIVFLGEGPGAEEDRVGEPFVGAAGQLLDKMISAMSLSRDEVYILNVVKCRPPGNRNPEPEEALACRDYLDRQLAILQPEFICCLGAVAAKNLLDSPKSVGQLRGHIWRHGPSKVVVTYHPAYLLRAPQEKRKAWEDLQLLMGEMGLL
ncbi:uracil-DNA glycosylase [Lignipirellula cremea]|uniref:Type-4 uracil-DNA glycosylase n=1 Tax=Lignipirellula cremea TaxID=2528010 RepID=A0A518DQR9_9BACT|nr:uracil-DNA glycosylase [Lignipirellula cremea]QDU94162.1 Uracil DNA glycosylase superfamily protein [Lignipirellula cremea]